MTISEFRKHPGQTAVMLLIFLFLLEVAHIRLVSKTIKSFSMKQAFPVAGQLSREQIYSLRMKLEFCSKNVAF